MTDHDSEVEGSEEEQGEDQSESRSDEGFQVSNLTNHPAINAAIQASQFEEQLSDFHKDLIINRNLQEKLNSIGRVQRNLEEVVRPVQEMQSVQLPTQEFQDLQDTVSAVQNVRAILDAYSQQWAQARETLLELRKKIQVAVEDQIELEMPWEYESTDPHPGAKTLAETWAEEFVEDFADVESEYFEQLITRMEDGLEEFQEGPERPYAAIHIFISMQDALLYWLCYQDDEISTEETNEIDLPKYGTNHKQNALRKHYTAFFGVEEDDVDRFSEYKWDCFWAHRHAIMHGDLHATYDMNIATTALLFFALTAHSVLQVIEDRDESGEDISAIIDGIEEAQEEIESEDVDPGEALGDFVQ